MVKRLVIVGGGSAGWLTAGVIAAEHRVARGPWPRGHAARISGRQSHRRGRGHLAHHARHAAEDRRERDGIHPPVRRLVQAGLEVRALGRWPRARLLLPSLRRAAGIHRDQPGRGLAQAARHHAVRGPGELSAAPVRAGQGAQAGHDARIRGGGQLRLPPGRRQVRPVPARPLRREARRAARVRPHDGRRAGGQRRHRRARDAQQRAHRRRPVRRLHRAQFLVVRRSFRRAVRLAAARAVQRHGAGAAGAIR